MDDITKKAYNEAIKLLKKCSTTNGFLAAYPSYHNLRAIWARDNMITSLGASLTNIKEFKKAFCNSLIILAKKQSVLGQIPNAVHDKQNKFRADYASIDSSLWFIIGEYLYKTRYKDDSIFKKHKSNINKALLWVNYQDSGEDGMPEQQPTSDWQDCFPHRYGHTINTQALYYWVLLLTGQKIKAKKLKEIVNNSPSRLWNGQFYWAYRWKSHNKYHEIGEWFDSLGNLLSIIFGLADIEKSKKILDYIEEKNIDLPYPVKSIYPPIKKDSRDWYDYFEDCEADKLFHYINGGIWPYIGGFYILALIKTGQIKKAKIQLKKLAEANMQGNGTFWEWLDGKTGKPGKTKWRKDNRNQAWSAGTYILAYNSVKAKRSLI